MVELKSKIMKKKTTGSWTDWKGEVFETPKLFLQDEANHFYGVEDADEFTWKLSSEYIEKVDNLSEDIYVQHVDGLEDDNTSITLGYQITKEEFEELLRKS